MLAEGEGREVATCGGKHSSSTGVGGWSTVLSRKNSVFLRFLVQLLGYYTKGHVVPVLCHCDIIILVMA
jgi:hypothetical protein